MTKKTIELEKKPIELTLSKTARPERRKKSSLKRSIIGKRMQKQISFSIRGEQSLVGN